MMGRGIRLASVLAFGCTVPFWVQGQTRGDDQAARYAAAGQQALSHGQYAEAQADFESLAKMQPQIAEVHATLAAICFKQREYDRAIREVRTAQRLKPGLPKLDSLLGLSLAEEGKFGEALPHLEKGFRQTSDSDVRRMCGLELLRAYTELQRDADAVQTSLVLNKDYPNDAEVLYHTGRIYGNYAWLTMEKLHDTAPNSIWMLQAQGEANESAKNWDAAIAAFNHVLTIDPNRPNIHYQLGRIYLTRFRENGKQEDRDAASREFLAELSVNPQNGNAAYELAYMQQEKGNLQEAARQFEDLLQRFPDFEEALVALGGIDISSQKPRDAVPLLERATQIRPNDEVAWWRLAQADHAIGNQQGQEQALAMFKRVHSTIPATLRKPDQVDEITPQQLDASAKP